MNIFELNDKILKEYDKLDYNDIITNIEKYIVEFGIYYIDNYLYLNNISYSDDNTDYNHDNEYKNNIISSIKYKLYRYISCVFYDSDLIINNIPSSDKFELCYNLLSNMFSLANRIDIYKLMDIKFNDIFKYIIDKYNNNDFCKDALVMSLYSLLSNEQYSPIGLEDILHSIKDDYIKLILYIKGKEININERIINIALIISKYKNIYEIYNGCYSNISNLLIKDINLLFIEHYSEINKQIIKNNQDLIKYINISYIEKLIISHDINIEDIIKNYTRFITYEIKEDYLYTSYDYLNNHEYIFNIRYYINDFILNDYKSNESNNICYHLFISMFDLLKNNIENIHSNEYKTIYYLNQNIKNILDYFIILSYDIFDIFKYFDTIENCEKYFDIMNEIINKIPAEYINDYKRNINKQQERYLKELCKIHNEYKCFS